MLGRRVLHGDPVHRKKGIKLVIGRLVHEFLEDPLEVGVRVEGVAAHLFDEGVNHRATPAGFLTTDEHPILQAQFSRTNGVLGEVVVKFDLSVFKARQEVRPLLAGVGQCFPQGTFGQDSFAVLEVGEEFFKVPVGAAEEKSPGSFSEGRTGATLSEPLFEFVDLAHLVEDPGGDSRVVVSRFPELPPNVGKAADGDDGQEGEAFNEGAVGAQAVALEVAVEGVLAFGVDEDVVQAGLFDAEGNGLLAWKTGPESFNPREKIFGCVGSFLLVNEVGEFPRGI